MQEMMAYAAAVGSDAAKRRVLSALSARNDGTAHCSANRTAWHDAAFADRLRRSTLRAAEMFRETFPTNR